MKHSWDMLDAYRGKLFHNQWPSIPEMLWITVEQYPDHLAFSTIEGKQKHTITYRQLFASVLGVAAYLKSHGIEKGDTVVIHGKNSPWWAIAYLGVQSAQAIAVPLDNQMTSDRVLALSEFSEAKAFIGDQEILEKISDSPWFQSVPITLMLLGNQESKWKALSTIPPATDTSLAKQLPSQDDVAAILFTSGTTGNEKGVVLTHGNFTSDVYQACDPQFLTISTDDILYALLPLHHSYTMTAVFLESIKHGCELLFGQGIVVSRVLNEMRIGEVTVFLAIPLLYNKLLAGLMKKVREKGIVTYAFIKTLMWINGVVRKTLHINPGRKWFHQLLDGIGMVNNEVCICGGGPLSPTTFAQYQQLGLDFVQGYGLTETAPILTLNPVSHFKVTSVGKVFPLVEMRIADPDLFGVGEVQVKGPNICQGYFKDPDNTRELFTEDGFLKTGDLGILDKENYLYLRGRAKNMIVTEGGKNVYPEEIEDLFQLYAQVEQIMIRGYIVNKSARAEGIEALIYPNEDYYQQQHLLKEAINHDIEKVVSEVNRKLVGYKKISKITILDKPMAMTSTKKIQRTRVARTIDRLRGIS
jgi:long-chain acyl-CoA synthetase